MTDSEDFAAMFEASLKAKRFEKGDTIEGRIVAIGPEVAFVDVGGKGEASIDIGELKDDDGQLEVSVGDRVQAMVVSTAGGLTLSRKLVRRAATERQLQDAYLTGLPVEGKVERAVKGGYEVRIAKQRAFCPGSQMDAPGAPRVRSGDPGTGGVGGPAPLDAARGGLSGVEGPGAKLPGSDHEGRVYEFRIIEYKEGGRNLIVSRRALLEEQQRAEAAKIRESIVVGAIITGCIASVRDFGAFVDLGGGVQGLLHVSEMGWSRVSDPAQMVKPGEAITVKVLRVDDDKQKISLGLKQLSADPWSRIGDTYQVGQILTGRVTRLTEFGAFVELEPGIEALAHVSTFAPAAAGAWRSQIAPGTTAAFEILSIDPVKKRIGVSLVPEGSVRATDERSEPADGEADAAAPPMGSLADKLRDALRSRGT